MDKFTLTAFIKQNPEGIPSSGVLETCLTHSVET